MHLILLAAIVAPFSQLATRIAAHPNIFRTPVVKLPIQKRFNVSIINPAQRDLIRARNPVEGVQRRDSGSSTLGGIVNVPLALNNTLVAYTAMVGIGNPPTDYELLIDTGSSNTWVGANKAYKVTNTSVKTSDRVNITYGSGNMTGTEYLDTLTIAPNVAICGQSIGVASNSSGFYPVDGILGVGPDGLTLGTLIPNNTNVIPTVTDNLFNQGKIEQRLIAVSFEPTTSPLATNGEITFGGIDPSKFTGEINYTPLTKTRIASEFWGIDASFRYGDAYENGSVAILNSTAGVVDTGTSILGLATDAYDRYLDVTGAVFDNRTGIPRITPEQFKKLKSLFFEIDGVTYELIPNAQIWPRALNTLLGGEVDSVYLVVSDLGPEVSGTFKLDFIIGMTVLERFYSVFDTTNERVGLATTRFTYANIN